MVVLLAALLAAPVMAAQDPAAVESRRRAVAHVVFTPESGAIEVRILDPDGAGPFPVRRLSVAAIGDRFERGRRIPADLVPAGEGLYRGTLGLSEGEWNLDVRVQTGEVELAGTFLLRVAGSTTAGVVPLVPPNPEVDRLAWLVGLMLGLPVLAGLALLAVGAVRQARERRDLVD